MLICATTWMNLRNIPSERSRHKKSYILRFHLQEMSRIGKSMETESRVGVTWGRVVGMRE